MSTKMMHPRPNPIVAAMYTLRDMDVDVILIHGPAGCGFMASRPLEEAGVRVVTSGMGENELIFGGTDALVRTLKNAYDEFHPKTMAIVGTCASMIIGEDMEVAVKRAALDCNVFAIDCHGCMGDNTKGAIKALEAACNKGILDREETDRQISLMKSATRLEKKSGMAARQYLSPSRGMTKLDVCRQIIASLKEGKKIAVVMIAKKELAYRFADMFPAMKDASAKFGGEVAFFANMDRGIGLPRIRRYCDDINSELEEKGARTENIGGLDEYAVIGDRMKERVDAFAPDMKIILGICHSYPDITQADILVTDQPRQLANYLEQGFTAVGEISSHTMVMGTRRIVPMETAETLRRLTEEGS